MNRPRGHADTSSQFSLDVVLQHRIAEARKHLDGLLAEQKRRERIEEIAAASARMPVTARSANRRKGWILVAVALAVIGLSASARVKARK